MSSCDVALALTIQNSTKDNWAGNDNKHMLYVPLT